MLRILDLGNFFVTTKEGVGPADNFQHELTQAKVGCAGTCLSEKLTGAEWPANFCQLSPAAFEKQKPVNPFKKPQKYW